MFICGGDFIPIVDGISNRTANTFVKEIKACFMLSTYLVEVIIKDKEDKKVAQT